MSSIQLHTYILIYGNLRIILADESPKQLTWAKQNYETMTRLHLPRESIKEPSSFSVGESHPHTRHER